MTVKLIDPDSGWKYGFPKILPENFVATRENVAVFLILNGYPIEDVAFGSKYYRIIG